MGNWDRTAYGVAKKIAPRHSTRALRHVLRIKKSNIVVCNAAIPDQYLNWYMALFENFS